MIVFGRRPAHARIRAFVEEQSRLSLTYPEVGGTGGAVPAGYHGGSAAADLGRGGECFAAARAAITRWAMFEMPHVQLCWAEVAPELDAVVAIVLGGPGFVVLNACRVVAVFDDEDDSGATFGFAYGTLPDHVGRGEERFIVKWNRGTDVVSYDVRSFSRPNGVVANLGAPVTRMFQAKFRRDSCRAMVRAVSR
ncbi:MAG TPA: DUF1990 domain-containing protein [Acidimicrobiia bacterium]|nr:DUF1990 domain-containing protein [Acidimicrobiia bacterium]